MHDDEEKDETEARPDQILFTADSRPTKARLLAGKATDKSRSIDRMLATRAAALIEALGTNIGSLYMHHRPNRHARQCPSCRAFTTLGVSIPTITETPQRRPVQPLPRRLHETAKNLRQKIFDKIVTEDLSEWTPPKKINWNTIVSNPATPQANPPSSRSRTTRPRKQTPTTEEPAPERTKRNHNSLQKAPEQKPSLPLSVLTQLVNVIKSQPINVCLACALPHTSALQKPSEDTNTHLLQDKHLDAWLEVCRIAQSVQPRLKVITPQKWKETASNPIESTQHRHLQGQKITLKPAHAHGHPRTGRILLVTEPPKHRKLTAFIHLDQKPEPNTKCTVCKEDTPQHNKVDPPKSARACEECNLVFHKKMHT